MNDYFEKMKGWKELMKTLTNIPDPSLRKLYRDTFVLKAEQDWGFNPDSLKKTPPVENNKPRLLDWEQKLADRINTIVDYGIDPQTQEEKKLSKKEILKAKENMYLFIKEGGTLVDIPPEIRTDKITELYFLMLKKVYGIE